MEKHVEDKLKDAARKAGGRALKWVSPGFTGVPDRIILLPGGRVWFAETKFARNTLSHRQRIVCDWLRKLGFTVLKVDETNVNDVIDTMF